LAEKSEQEASGNYAQLMQCMQNAKLVDSLLRARPVNDVYSGIEVVANSPIALTLARTNAQKWTTAGSAVAMLTSLK